MANIVIVVFDGLQPAQVTLELMPNLARFAAEGVACNNHHAVFPTVTRANVASIVTGHQPGAHGLTGNMLVIPEFDPHRAINTLEPTLSEVAARTPVLLRPTLGDILHRHGREFIAVGTGTSGNAYLQNPNAETGGGATIHPDFCLPRPLHGELTAKFGPWPDRREPGHAKLARAVEIVTEYVLAERQPAVSCSGSPNPIPPSTPTALAQRKPSAPSGKPTGNSADCSPGWTNTGCPPIPMCWWPPITAIRPYPRS